MPLPHFMCGVVEGFYGRPWTMEQRCTLFGRMQRMGMTEYMYAPNDDLKHRAEWRLPYTNEETECLGTLIRASAEHNVTFIYAVSPGIDIRYSSDEEVQTLLNKFKRP
jgi:protein O-GlcNAcase/histone acetyltransferase